MARPRRWTGRPGPTRAGTLRARPLTAADLTRLGPCSPACGLAALDPADLLTAIGEGTAAAYVAVPCESARRPPGVDPGPGPAAPEPSAPEPSAPVVVVAAPSFAARCSWIPGPPGPDAWVVLGLRTGAEPDPAVGRLLLRAAVGGLRAAGNGRVQALEAWAGVADPCEGTPAWWRELGFEVVRPHPIRPRMRTELRGWLTRREAPLARRTSYVRGAIAPETYDVVGVQRSSRSSASRS